MKLSRAIYVFLAASFIVLCCGAGRKPIIQGSPGIPKSLAASYLYTEGVKAGLMGDVKAAEELLEEVITLDSTHGAAYFELAALYVTSDTEKATSYSRKAYRQDTTNIWFRNLEARLMILTGRYDEAFDMYSKLAADSPYNPDNYRMMAALYEQRGQPFRAIAILDSAEYKLGRIEELADMKRQLLIDASLYDKALAETKAMIVEYPWNDRNYRILGMLYNKMGNDSLALSAYREALRINPSSIDNIASLNTFYRSRNDVPNFFSTARDMMNSDQMEAGQKIAMINELRGNKALYTEYFFQIKDLVSTLLIKYPDNYDVIDLYGTTLIALGGAQQALPFYKSQLKDPKAPIEIFNMVMDMEAYLKHPDSLYHYSRMALDRFPGNTDVYIRQANSLAYMEQYDEALSVYKTALKHSSSDSLSGIVLGLIGDLYHHMGDKKQCYKYYERALRKLPDNAMTLNNFSYYLVTDGENVRDLSKAIAMAEKACSLSTGNATYLDTYAWALFKDGQLTQAKKIMQQAISLDTSESEVLMAHYGDILYALKEYFMASVYWKKALEKGYDEEGIREKLKKVEGK